MYRISGLIYYGNQGRTGKKNRPGQIYANRPKPIVIRRYQWKLENNDTQQILILSTPSTITPPTTHTHTHMRIHTQTHTYTFHSTIIRSDLPKYRQKLNGSPVFQQNIFIYNNIHNIWPSYIFVRQIIIKIDFLDVNFKIEKPLAKGLQNRINWLVDGKVQAWMKDKHFLFSHYAFYERRNYHWICWEIWFCKIKWFGIVFET